MSKIIELIHPYQLKGINCINDYLLVLKNIINLLNTSGYKEKMDGILVPIRWSIDKNKFVLDRGTLLQRDRMGVSIEELDNADIPNELKIAARYVLNVFNNNNDLSAFCEEIGMKKNQDKFLSFEYVSGITNRIKYDFTTAYPIGLFYMQRNKKSKIIDLSDNIINKISSFSEKFTINKIQQFKKYNVFEDFINSIDKNSLSIKVEGKDKLVNIKETITSNHRIYKNKIKIKNKKYHFNSLGLLNAVKEKGCTESEFLKIKANILVLHLNEVFGNYIKQTVLNLNNIEGIVVYDKKNNLLYKITGSFYTDTVSVINNKQKRKVEKYSYNYLPGVF